MLNCTHTFCDECINSWTRRVNQCPTCRVTVKTKLYCLTLDTFLDKIAEYLPDNVKTRRESIKVERLNNSRHINRSNESFFTIEIMINYKLIIMCSRVNK